jgi:hypothetical protein
MALLAGAGDSLQNAIYLYANITLRSCTTARGVFSMYDVTADDWVC